MICPRGKRLSSAPHRAVGGTRRIVDVGARHPQVVRLWRCTVLTINYSAYSALLPPICSAITLWLCLGADPIARYAKLLDVPGGRKSHRQPTPLMGGVCLLVGFYPWVALWTLLGPGADVVPQLTIIACSALLTLLGIFDDRRHLPASFRLLSCAVLISLTLFIVPDLVLQQISWNYGTGAVGLPVGRFAYSALCIVALIQAANLADGKNGLLIGLSLAWVYFLMGELPTGMSPMLLALTGVLIVLLSFNLSGRLFLGDGGSYGLATFIGLMALLTANSPASDASSDQIALIFLLPVIDMLRLIIVRVSQGRSPFAGDRDHLHHHLLAAFGWPGGLVVYLMTATLPSFIAAAAPRHTLSLIAMTVVAYFLVIVYARRASRHKRDGTTKATGADAASH